MFNECYSYLLGGGPVLYTIFAFSIIAWIFIFHKLIVFKNTGTQSHRRHDEIIEMVKDDRVPESLNTLKLKSGLYSKIIRNRWQDESVETAKDDRVLKALNICKSKDGLYSKTIHNTLLLKGHTPHQFDRASAVNILREKPKLERFNSTIGLIAGMCPLLGLLGTVLGMISTFYIIAKYGTGDPGLMGKGISQALITTQVGLFLAVPILFFYEFLENRKQSVKWDIELYIKKLKTVLCSNNDVKSLSHGQKDSAGAYQIANAGLMAVDCEKETTSDIRQFQEAKTENV